MNSTNGGSFVAITARILNLRVHHRGDAPQFWNQRGWDAFVHCGYGVYHTGASVAVVLGRSVSVQEQRDPEEEGREVL